MKRYVFALAGALAFTATGSYYLNHQTEDISRAPAHYRPRTPPPPEPDPVAAAPRTILSGLHCEFSAAGFADATADYDPVTNTLTATWGDPPTTQQFNGITVLTGLPPYNATGISLIAFGDSPLIHVTFESTTGTFPATWGQIPGGPTNILNAGTCTVSNACAVDDDDNDGEEEVCKDPRHRFMPKHKHHKRKKH